MLQIQEIKKEYTTGDLVQTALDGVSLTLRDSEFVAVLGPSGSGKTTLLNVIGGLDRYDSGDLIINGISTKKYSDRDWDSYRNHTIGFVFQSYNLIPHQTVLANVELALTISGISPGERRKRAVAALKDVGLGDQLHKRPNQMSGGQMQRVAIARALVNDPDILLADEPTGALDSETSMQVMELLKEVSQNRLVVMVTHNPELAELYANRIVRVKDGRIIGDSNPFILEENSSFSPQHKNMGRASMSFLTALSLSFNNLRTKKGRTLLTAFAGSIGIIGIALIMSLSTGFQQYIDKIQEDTLANYPLSIQSETADMSAMMSAYGAMLGDSEDVPQDVVQEQQMISQMFAQVGTNDLVSFKKHLEQNMDLVEKDINDLQYTYGVKPLIFAADTSNGILRVNPSSAFQDIPGMSMMSSYMGSDIFYEMINNRELLASQYDLLQGEWPDSANEMVIVLSSPNKMTDYMAYTLGLKDTADLKQTINTMMNGEEADVPEHPQTWTYDDLMDVELRLVSASGQYRYNEEYAVWEDMSDDVHYMSAQIEAGMPLTITGIVCPKDGVTTSLLMPGIAYTSGLTELVIDDAAGQEIVAGQLDNPDIDVFTGKIFGSEESGGLNFENMISVDGEKITSAFGMNVDANGILSFVKAYLSDSVKNFSIDIEPAKKDFTDTFALLAEKMLVEYIHQAADPETGSAHLPVEQVCNIVCTFMSTESADVSIARLAEQYGMQEPVLSEAYSTLLQGMLLSYIAQETTVPNLPDIPALPETPETPNESLPPMEPSEPEIAPEPDLDTVPAAVSSLTDVTDAVQESTAPETQPSEFTEPGNGEETPNDGAVGILYANISMDVVDSIITQYMPCVEQVASAMAPVMLKTEIAASIEREVQLLLRKLMGYVGSAVQIDEEMLSSAFQFNMDEKDLTRLMSAMSGSQEKSSYAGNLRKLGYADMSAPTSISVYFVDFEAKSHFLEFLDAYNADMENQGKEKQIIRYTDITNIMMSSVRTIIDSVSYVLIAFVAVSLIVSSIMIGIITYISVMERTKEIGILRAIGASKRNISQVFNAETFIIGLCSGLIGIGLTLLLNVPINALIHHLADNQNINAQLPAVNAVILVILSMLLTLVGGLIPSRHAAKKDPVIALRTE